MHYGELLLRSTGNFPTRAPVLLQPMKFKCYRPRSLEWANETPTDSFREENKGLGQGLAVIYKLFCASEWHGTPLPPQAMSDERDLSCQF